MYVGTLTADEIVFVSGKGIKNHNSFLMNTYAINNQLYWWSLSPEVYNVYTMFTIVYAMDYDGYLNSGHVYHSSYYSRPAVTLKPDTVILDGDGTLENPYTIN